jgi:hypothetical protein
MGQSIEEVNTKCVEVTMTSAYESLQGRIAFLEEVAEESRRLKDKFNLGGSDEQGHSEPSSGRKSSNMAESLQNYCEEIDMLTSQILVNINYLSEKLG